jgi:MFS family permease
LSTPLTRAPFRWLLSASVANSLASGIERTATGWLVLEAGGDALSVGLVLAARMLPPLLFGLAAGTAADRADRPRLLAGVAAVGVPLMALMAALAATGDVQLWQLVTISFGLGCMTVFDITARQTLAVDSVPREMAANGVALNSLVTRLSGAGGAFVAGFAINAAGVPSCYGIAAIMYALAALLVWRVRVAATRHAQHANVSFARAMANAARLVVDVPAVRTLCFAAIACEIFAFSHPTAVPVIARDVLDAGAEGLGVLNASIALGGTLGVLLLSLLPGRVRREPVLGGVFVTYGVALLALAAARSLPIASATLLVIGACAGSFDALQQTLMQMAVPDELRGRAMGLWMFAIGSAPIGLVETGLLVTALGAPAALAINGLAVLVSAAVLLITAPVYRGAARFSGAGSPGRSRITSR